MHRFFLVLFVCVLCLSCRRTAPPAASEQEVAVGTADVPVPRDDPLFMPAHEALLKKARSGVIDIYFAGDSITRRWHANDYPKHQEVWKRNFFGWNAADFGWGSDQTQHALWRLANGELDGVNPKVVVLLIGTNNVGFTPPEDGDVLAADVARGIKAMLDVFREKVPEAKIVLMGILPRNHDGGTALMPTIDKINDRIARYADGSRIIYLNINDKLADERGRLFDGVTEDGLHLSDKGYQIWADALQPIFTEVLGPPAKTDQAPPPTGIPDVP